MEEIIAYIEENNLDLYLEHQETFEELREKTLQKIGNNEKQEKID
jgi:hypothetical protein